MKAPCKDCTERHRACHDHCERYKAFKAASACLSEARRAERDLENSLINYEKERFAKIERRRKRK